MEKVEMKSQDKVTKILFVTMIVSIVLAVTTIILYAFIQGSRMFSDFAETLSYCLSKNPYTGEDGIRSIYPPFAFLPFYLFALICKTPLQSYIAGDINLTQLSHNPLFILSFILFYLIFMGLILLVSAKVSKFQGKKLVYLLISIFGFGPCIYCFCRGNNIMSVALLVLLFFWLYNSEKRWARELGNLCLAGAIAIKIYPLLLLVFFLKDKRWLDMLKTLLYGLALIFLPFLLIKGGFANIKEIWNNFTTFNSGEGREMNWTNIGFDSLAAKFSSLITLITTLDTTAMYSILSKILRFGSIVVTIVALILSKNTKHKMQAVLITMLTYQLFQGVSYAYTLTMLIFPILMYLIEFENLSKVNRYYYGICFAIVAISLWASIGFFLIVQLALVCMLVKGYIDLFKDFMQRNKLRKEEKQKALEEKETKAA